MESQSLTRSCGGSAGNLTGRQDLMERGVAAMRATLAILTEPRTQANNYPTANIDPSSGRPFVAHGLEPENVDHEGIPQLPARSGPDCKPSANCPAPLNDI